jgi:bifunctional DNA-binding transcriptional regulator/antitoxin component of YhaV-PrlF toxin-antitoxin module
VKRPPAERSSDLGDTRASAALHPDFRAPEPGTMEASAAADQPVRPISRDVWVTKDGRELTIKEMYRPHLGNAQAVLSVWLKREKDPVKRRELKSWRSKMRRELVKREKAWQAKRKKEAGEPS